MPSERKHAADIDFTDAELRMFGDFVDAVLAGRKPNVEEHVRRCPGSEAKMRPILETALLLDREVTQFKRKYPHVDLRRMLELARKTRHKKK